MYRLSFILLFLFISFIVKADQPYIDPKQDSLDMKYLDDKSWNVLYNNPDSAIIYAEELYQLAVEKNSLLFQAYSFNTKGIAYDIKGDNFKALENYNECMQIYKSMNDIRGIGVSHLNIGIIYYNQGMYLKAMEEYRKSLNLFEKAKDKRGIADANNNISIIYKTQKQYKESLKYLESCLPIYKEINDEQGIGITYMNIGIVYELENDKKSALEYFLKSIQIAEKINDQIMIGSGLVHLGQLYQENHEIDKALKHYEKAYDIALKLEDLSAQSIALNNIGSIHNLMGKPQEGIKYCRQGLKISENINDLDNIMDNCYCLYESYSKLGDDHQALQYFKSYNKWSDSLLNESVTKEILQQSFQKKFREKEITDSIQAREKEIIAKAQLDAKNAKLKAQDQELKNERIIGYTLILGLLIVAVFGWIMYNRFKLTRKQNIIIEEQKEIVEEKNKNITDSINYALRIQQSFLPKESEIKKYFEKSFIIYQPKDIVSGDFYWLTPVNGNHQLIVLAIADCTGHGVPGAMMTMIGNTLLNQTIGNNNINTPAEALNFLNEQLPLNLKKNNLEADIKDGFDIVMCEIDKAKNLIYFSGANNTLIKISNGIIEEFKGDKQAISASSEVQKFPFTHQEISYQKGDRIYITTDGLPDQFGGPNGKKYKIATLRRFLISIQHLPFEDQKIQILNELNSWMKPSANIHYEQVDDITLLALEL